MPEWLQWFSAVDWSHLDNVLSSIVGVTVLTGIGWAGVKFGWNPLSERLGRRRAQAKLLDQLACGSSVAYVESLFGAAQFLSIEDDREQRTYQLPGGWVMVELHGNAVIAFSITITKRRMRYSTKRLTFRFLKTDLGKSKYAEHGIGYDGERYWIGARRVGYQRTYAFGNPGGYQRYWLSYNMSGVGAFSLPQGEPAFVERGSFVADVNSPARSDLTQGIDASEITINTLTVLSPEGPESEFLARHTLGPDESRVRLAQSIKQPTGRTLLGDVKAKWYLTKQRAKSALPWK
jgi:hypothetical protein